MRHAFVLLIVTLCLAGACADRGVHVVSKDDLPADVYPEGARTPRPSEAARVTIYLLDGNRLAPVSRTGRSNMPLPELVLRALLSGPTRDELAQGLATALPPAVELAGVSVTNGIANVDFNSAFETPTKDELLRRVAQVVYTLSELDSVDAVSFFTDGHRYTVLDQNNDTVSDPVAQGRYSRFAPRNALGGPVSTGRLRLDLSGDEEAAVP
jgi:hypothetical protein